VLHVTGARPNFPKAAPVIAALESLGVPQHLVHTGQHYDDAMSESFFRDLDLPRPDVNLGVGSGSHAQQTAAIMMGMERVLLEEQPGLVVVYGDVNSTVGAALVAAKLDIPVAHVEAGLRSFDDTMPEEINRRVTDHLSSLHFVTSPDGVDNLSREGITGEGVHFVGNPMIDTLLAALPRVTTPTWIDGRRLPAEYAVVTLHRPGNVDDESGLPSLVATLHHLADQISLVFPMHPRGREGLLSAGLDPERVLITEPMGYLDFVGLVRGARAVVTDSGGIQEETTILGIPCLTLRPNTERPVTITHGTNQLVDVTTVASALAGVLVSPPSKSEYGPPLWDGHAGSRIALALVESLDAGTS
jgi:UDP-N-acetylglucosamine 2-epimerase (non-hydrolysing)